MIWLILPGGVLIVLLAWLIRAFLSRAARIAEMRAAEEADTVESLTVALDLTHDEAEQLTNAGPIALLDPVSWRRNRLRRHADAQCEGMPTVVRRNMERLIDEAPQRAARVLDDGDELRQWMFEEGIKQ